MNEPELNYIKVQNFLSSGIRANGNVDDKRGRTDDDQQP